jgi:hypothetical protein
MTSSSRGVSWAMRSATAEVVVLHSHCRTSSIGRLPRRGSGHDGWKIACRTSATRATHRCEAGFGPCTCDLPVNTLPRLVGRHDAAASEEGMQHSVVVEVGWRENLLRGRNRC